MPQAAALLLKPPVTVTVLCFLLPDLVDKPLWALGVGCGRYVAHTLLFVFLVSLAFALKKRAYGVFALFGGMLHLLTDIGWFIPWLYPFVRYDFPQLEFIDHKLVNGGWGTPRSTSDRPSHIPRPVAFIAVQEAR